ncbi:MAG: hypothetical protein QXY45_01670 [Candidatus Aenigmatarchaeota archaeon]
MSKKSLIPLLIFLFSLAQVFSEVIVSSPDSIVTVYAGKTNEMKILVKNDGYEKDVVYISVWPSQWVNLDRYWVTLESKQSEFLTIFLTPPEDIEEGVYLLTINSQSLTSNKNKTETIFLSVRRLSDVFISDLKINKGSINPGETLEIEAIITNLNRINRNEVYLELRILDEGGKLVKRFEKKIEVDPRSVVTIKENYGITSFHNPGNYIVEADLRNLMNNLIDRESEIFEIRKNVQIEKQRVKEYGFFYTDILITITNRGNIETDYTLEENLPKVTRSFFLPEKNPDFEETKENRVVYKWYIFGIKPGETILIKYRLRFINAFIGTLLLTLLLLVSYEYLTRPVIKKTNLGSLLTGEELKITLLVKNKKPHPIKNVVVKDTVPAIARLVKQFDTREPEIKLTNQGTELTWKIDKINPGEEILLTYKIKPMIDVIGKLSLPKSYFTYKSGFKMVRKITSKSVSVAGKIK